MQLYGNSKPVMVDRIIWFLTVLQFSCIFIFESSSWGVVYIAIISIVICLLEALKNNWNLTIAIEPFHLFITGFAAFSLLSSIWAWDKSLAIEKGITLFEILICFSLVYFHYRSKPNVKQLFDAIMWGCYGVIIYCILTLGWNTVLYAITNEERLNTFFTNVNSLGIISALAVVLSFYRIQHQGIRAWNLLVIPTIALIAASGSRKALIFLVLGVSLVYITHNSGVKWGFLIKGIRMIIVGVLIFIVIRMLSSLSLFSGINLRMKGLVSMITGSGTVDHSILVRRRMIEIGWAQFLKTPALGIGMGNARIMTASIGYDSYLHNNYIELLADGGVVGFLSFYSMYIHLVVSILRYRKPRDDESLLCIILIICFLVVDLGYVSYYSKSSYYYLMAWFIEAAILKNQAHQSHLLEDVGNAYSS